MSDDPLDVYVAAARAGDADAMYQVARILMKSGDPVRAEQWARTAAQAGSTKGMRVLGHMHEQRGEGGEAEHWYRLAADGGDVWSMSAMARRFRGNDDLQAVHWYRMAAAARDLHAALELALLLAERGELDEAEHWATEAAAGRDARALHYLADILERQGKTAAAEQHYRRSAELGFFLAAAAMFRIATERRNEGEALRWQGRMAETEVDWVNRIARGHQ
ncbi:MAG: hypothetical protein HOV94_18120 [Saccharothrix sp.]|nr:hypothetical protein [Saccharothrix sp.]